MRTKLLVFLTDAIVEDVLSRQDWYSLSQGSITLDGTIDLKKLTDAILAKFEVKEKDALRNEKGNNESGHEAEAHGKDEG